MKKYLLTKVGKDGKEKRVPVFIPEETAILLDQCEEEIRRVYLEEEYKASKKGRAEIRRHISLDAAMENGFDIENSEPSAIELMLSKEETVDKHNQCEFWRNDYSMRTWRENVAKKKLNGILDEIIQIRQILWEEKDENQINPKKE